MSNKLPINGWLNLNKPLGITSAKAVAIVKRGLHPAKIGHAGTLDPLASGVLPLALGEATKTMQFCMDTDKEYEFTLKWGEATATLDSEGEVIARSDVRPTQQQILEILPQFIGKISQTPPAYSAIKINGQRAYDLARQGVEVNMKAREVNIYSLEVAGHLTSSPPMGESDFFNSKVIVKKSGEGCINGPHPGSLQHPDGTSTFHVACGKGTYIRSLARDIAAALGTLAHVTALTRTKVGNFSIKDAILLEDIEKTVYKDSLSGVLLPVDTVLDDIQVLEFTPLEAGRIRNGQRIFMQNLPNYTINIGGVFIAKCDGILVAICEFGDGIIKPLRIFNL
jgi:tRNA pseudouridine55 synthase